jgi:glutamate-1-semialdehyde 2,1-aminomutase
VDFKKLVDSHRGNIAAVMLTPHQHDAMKNQELPTKEFVNAVNDLAKKEGFLIIVDDIRCGFRLKIEGSALYYGWNADLQCFGKAMANGYPISVAMGRDALKDAAKKIFFTGTHFFSGVPFAAALAAIEEIQSSDAIQKIDTMGKKLMKGLEESASANGLKVTLSGPPAMPFMTFADDPIFETSRYFCGEAARRGIFFHPHHNWFVCAALTDEDMKKTLAVADECFKLTKKKLGG